MYQHSFDVEIAEKFNDANIAVVFSNLCFWISKNKANRKNRFNVMVNKKIEQRYFTYNSVTAFREIFFYLTENQIRLCLTKLVKAGLIVKTRLSNKGYDKTAWYCLVDEDYWTNKYYKYNSGEGAAKAGCGMEEDDSALFDKEGVVKPPIDGAVLRGEPVCEIRLEGIVEESKSVLIENSEDEKTGNDAGEKANSMLIENSDDDKTENDLVGKANPSVKKHTSMCEKTQIDVGKNTDVRTDINTNINKSSSSSEKLDFEKKEKEEEVFNKKVDKKGVVGGGLGEVLLKLDASFVFSADFYENACIFMRENEVDNRYLGWIYEQCVKAKPNSLRNYYYKTFFKQEFLNMYKSVQKSELFGKVKVNRVKVCPVCGAEYERECENCGFGEHEDGSSRGIAKLKKLYLFSAEKKKEYHEKKDTLLKSAMQGELNFMDYKKGIEDLDLSFGIKE